MAATALQGAATLLSSHSGRDKLLRTIQFTATLCSGCTQGRFKTMAEKLAVISGDISQARMLLRFLSDIPALSYTLNSLKSLRKEGRNSVEIFCQFVQNITGLVYLPIEHLAWLADKNIISKSKSRFLWSWCIWLWVSLLLAGILGSIATILRIQQQLSTAIAEGEHEHSSSPGADTPSAARLRRQQKSALLLLAQHCTDLIIAVHWIPEKCLWSGQLSPTGVGFFGTTSSLISLYTSTLGVSN